MRRMGRVSVYALAALGLGLSALLVAGFVTDARGFDRTEGAYEPPYTDFTGEPIDWESETYVTQTGFFKDGYVLDLHADCASGVTGFEVFGRTVHRMEFSGRALAVHKPREACERAGFEPGF